MITDGILSHSKRCENNCLNKSCYFHPEMGTKEYGLDIDHPITIPEFIRRFGCATYDISEPMPDNLPDIDEIMGQIEQNGFYTGYREDEMVVKISDIRTVLEEYFVGEVGE
jgi:hypothetical protein